MGITSFDVVDNIIAYGDFDGKIYVFNNETSGYIHHQYPVAQGEGMIVNSLTLLS